MQAFIWRVHDVHFCCRSRECRYSDEVSRRCVEDGYERGIHCIRLHVRSYCVNGQGINGAVRVIATMVWGFLSFSVRASGKSKPFELLYGLKDQ